jgi:hypothetical protein
MSSSIKTNTKYQSALCKGILLNSMFYTIEIKPLETLQNSYGGAFELLIFTGHKFVKTGNILNLFWHVDAKDLNNVSLNLIPKFIKQDYFEDVFLVCTANFELEQSGQGKMTSMNLSAISPIDKTLERSVLNRLPKPNLNSSFLSNSVLVETSNGFHSYAPSINYCKDSKDSPFQFKESAGKVDLFFEKDFFDARFRKIISNLKENLG